MVSGTKGKKLGSKEQAGGEVKVEFPTREPDNSFNRQGEDHFLRNTNRVGQSPGNTT